MGRQWRAAMTAWWVILTVACVFAVAMNLGIAWLIFRDMRDFDREQQP